MSSALGERERRLFELLGASYMSRDPNNNEVVIFWDGEPLFRFERYYTAAQGVRALAVVDFKALGGTTSLERGECVRRTGDNEYESVKISADNSGIEFNYVE